MRDRKEGVPKEHPRARVSHHRLDPISHARPVTVNGTLSAGGLPGLERTLRQPIQGV